MLSREWLSGFQRRSLRRVVLEDGVEEEMKARPPVHYRDG
jgi:hypothetical protein